MAKRETTERKQPYVLTEEQVEALMRLACDAGALWNAVASDKHKRDDDAHMKWLRSQPLGARKFILDSY
jgi:hypothetical protein